MVSPFSFRPPRESQHSRFPVESDLEFPRFVSGINELLFRGKNGSTASRAIRPVWEFSPLTVGQQSPQFSFSFSPSRPSKIYFQAAPFWEKTSPFMEWEPDL